jgi:hypothetical protein
LNTRDFSQSTAYLDHFINDKHNQIANSIELRQNMVTFLHFVRNNKVVGTQSTGNMPLKMISQLSKELVNPPKLENKVGDKIYRVRSETEVWPIYFPHILAEGGNLVRISKGKQWKLKSKGDKFLIMPELIQLWFLLMIWWHRINWLVAFQIMGIGENLPPHFERSTLEHFLIQINENSISFDDFADSLIDQTGLTWFSQDKSFHNILLRGSIEHVVIHIHEQFGIVDTEYEDEIIGNYKTKKLKSFKVTTLGKTLIEAIRLSFP